MLLLGVVQAQVTGAPAAAGSYDLLQTEILTGSQASVTFSDLGDYAGTYQHLQIRAVSRLDNGAGQEAQGAIRFNGDSGNNYSSHWLAGFGSGSPSSTAFTSTDSMRGIDHALAAAATGNFGASVIDILDPFENTKYTTIRSLSGVSSASIFLISGSWRNTDPVSSITLQGPADQTWQMVEGTRISLYGLKASV
jgi:hypothetical protein